MICRDEHAAPCSRFPIVRAVVQRGDASSPRRAERTNEPNASSERCPSPSRDVASHLTRGSRTLSLGRASSPLLAIACHLNAFKYKHAKTLACVLRVVLTPHRVVPSSRSTTTVPFSTAADAKAVRDTLAVDHELQPDKVSKTLKVEGTNLVA